MTVSPNAAAYFGIAGPPSTAVVEKSTSVTLTAYDAYGNVATGYTGTVHFTSSDKHVIAPDTPFSVANQGTQTIPVTFNTVGGQDLSATDTMKNSITGSASLFVSPPADLFQSTVSIGASSVQAGATSTVTLTAVDSSGHQLPSGGLNVAFGLGNNVGGGTFNAVTDNGNGTYTTTFTGTTAGANTITTTIDGQLVASAAPSVTVTPGGKPLPVGHLCRVGERSSRQYDHRASDGPRRLRQSGVGGRAYDRLRPGHGQRPRRVQQ